MRYGNPLNGEKVLRQKGGAEQEHGNNIQKTKLESMFYPSIMAHMMNGLFLLAALVFVIYSYSKLRALDSYHILVLILLGSVALGVHGLSHAVLEKHYKFVPFNLWKLD